MLLALVFVLPMPTRKLELLLPPETFSAPPPDIVRAVVIGAERFELPTMKAALVDEFSPVSAELLVMLNDAPLPMTMVPEAALLVEALKALAEALTPASITSVPTGSFVLVPVFGVPSETRLAAAPRLPPVPTTSVPLLTCTPPEKVLAPESLSKPDEPPIANPALPAMGA